MSFQAGLLHFDDREILEREAATILRQAESKDCGVPTSYREGGVFLGHAAVPFDSRSAAEIQPYVAPPGAITFDGRLDNRNDQLLLLRDFLRGDTSDSALALAAYEKWGPDGLIHLIGDWSLVIWDAAEKSVMLASDFAGVRPLYYCVQPDRVLWSSHLGPLADWAPACKLDDQYVAGLLMYGGSPSRTPFSGIFSVPPGHYVRVRKDRTTIQPYWNPPIGSTIRYQRESDYEEHLRAFFREAVRCRLPTNTPALCDLSGGLDSSSVVCMASHLIRSVEVQTPPLVTLTYEHQGSIDAPFYTALEKYCGVEGIHVPTDAHPFLTETHTGGAMPAFWEPIHAHVAELARQRGAKTYLTGRAGDLIMGNWWDDSDQVAGLLRIGRIGSALRDSLAWSKLLRIPIYWVLWRAFLATLPPSLARATTYRRSDGSYAPKRLENSVAPSFLDRTGMSTPQNLVSRAWTQAPPERRKLFRGVMETLELRKLQPTEALQHLYYTHPYAHRPLVEFMLSIPAPIVCRPGEPRRLMRTAFRELWPPELRKRRSKDAFTGVFLESLRPLATDMLQRSDRLQVVERGYVDLPSLKERLKNLTHSLDCNEPQLRYIILLEYWLRGRESRPRTGGVSLSVSA